MDTLAAVVALVALVVSVLALALAAHPARAAPWRTWYAEHLESVIVRHVDRSTVARELGANWPPGTEKRHFPRDR